jgi:hypothetical protein
LVGRNGDERSSSFLVSEIIWQHIIRQNRVSFIKIVPWFTLSAFQSQNSRLKGLSIFNIIMLFHRRKQKFFNKYKI